MEMELFKISFLRHNLYPPSLEPNWDTSLKMFIVKLQLANFAKICFFKISDQVEDSDCIMHKLKIRGIVIKN